MSVRRRTDPAERQQLLLLVAVLLALSSSCSAQVFFPGKCEQVCVNGYQDVSTTEDDFFTIDPSVYWDNCKKPAFQATRASEWGVALLRAVRDALQPLPPGSQTATLTPPAVGRLLGAYSMAVYQAHAVWAYYLQADSKFNPLSNADLNLAAPDRWDEAAMTLPPPESMHLAADKASARGAQMAAISGAASNFLTTFFCNLNTTPEWCKRVKPIIDNAMITVGNGDHDTYPIPFQQGANISSQFIMQLRLADLLNDTPGNLPQSIRDIPPSQPTAGVSSCANLHVGWWHWQRLTVPKNASAFTPSRTAKYPPAGFSRLTPSNTAEAAVPFFRGYAAISTPALKSTSTAMAVLLKDLNGPPGSNDPSGFNSAMKEVLTESARLDDKKKTVAEFWADGPDSTTPPGHWMRIAIEESSSAFSIASGDALDKAVWAMFTVGVSLHEAAVLAWQLKIKHMGARPVTGIQCRVGRDSAGTPRTGSAWRGPYLGVGVSNLSTWLPFQEVNFVTPPFAGYVSGHATFSAAAAEALRNCRSGFNTSFTMPGYNCFRTPAGKSKVEPSIGVNETGHVQGVTDVPNRGPRSIGYSPAKDIVMCWDNYDQAAKQAADSRLYGGIHIRKDNEDGLVLGRRIGQHVAGDLIRLAPARNLPKDDVVWRSEWLGSRAGRRFQQEHICPPGTYVRGFTGSTHPETAAISTFSLECSDGTRLFSLGSEAFDATAFATNASTGYRAVKASINGGSISALWFVNISGSACAMFGASAGEAQSQTCRDGERLIGLSVAAANEDDTPAALQLLCGSFQDDVTYQTELAPSPGASPPGVPFKAVCPHGTFITAFGGVAPAPEGGGVALSSVICSNGWQLLPIGWARGAPAFNQSAADGFSGISVAGHYAVTGIAAIEFTMTNGTTSSTFGSLAGASLTQMRCDDFDTIVGLYGWASRTVNVLGAICAPGGTAALAANQELAIADAAVLVSPPASSGAR